VVQYYLSDLQASTEVPLNSLVGFQRVSLKAGESQTVEFIVTPEMMKMVNDAGQQVLEPGDFRLTVGSCSPGQRGIDLGAAQPLSAVFTLA
jgi:beta-glucosidase